MEEVKIRPARKKDVSEIVSMLADDKLGSTREDFRDPLPKAYYEAFSRISTDPNQELMVVINDEGRVIGTLQLSLIPYLTYRGGTRAQIEAVRIHKDYRGKGIGKLVFKWCIERAREKGAHVVQLTTDKNRSEAIKFYEDLGFRASHEGMKLHL
ncbi:GNAT family N-acetyltransferase [Lentiprolixibacter aurantiacus]|uniref:GNAT family N-acetyltransferase n=1 Tax=Lentiprolixibacter aurantiacus TaxID=2993939 RepID=A0AAE3MMU9_9FLAO|nr:GNAT family N-acetyltransferase [Lentiprolixibacter aurantiacus]MCX2720246.1 GNAT family N-acetyltransferase [Lentiprolixibacter aurantiacus]